MEEILTEPENGVDGILDRYADMVYKLALSQTKNASDAEDVFQEVFLRLVKTGARFESEEHAKAWLIRVTLNCCRNLWRSAWFRHTAPLKDDLAAEGPEESGVLDAVCELPFRYRAVIHLYYYQSMPVKEISEALHVKESTVTSRLCRARAILKRELKGEFGDDDR